MYSNTTYFYWFFSLWFVSEEEKLFYMSASASGPAPKRGRPSYGAEAERIRLRLEVFNLWTQKRKILDTWTSRTVSLPSSCWGFAKKIMQGNILQQRVVPVILLVSINSCSLQYIIFRETYVFYINKTHQSLV